MDETLAIDRIKIAALHLEGRAIQWHQSFMKTKDDMVLSWEEYIASMRARFGHYAYDDPIADLKNLKQVYLLQHYLDKFDELYLKTSIKEDQALSFFLTRLVDELQMSVHMFKPRTLSKAYCNIPP